MTPVLFTKLTLEETARKLSILRHNQSFVFAWSGGGGDILEFSFKNYASSTDTIEVLLSLPVSLKHLIKVDDVLFGSFFVGGMQYFFESQVARVGDDDFSAVFINDKKKKKKREADRLLTYPHMNVYVFIGGVDKKNSDDNVIYFDKKTRKKRGQLDEYKVELYKSMLGDEYVEDDYMTFRVMDISATGASLIASAAEKSVFSEREHFEKAILVSGNSRFSVTNVNVVGVVDYLDPRFPGVPMFKVNLRFECRDETFSKFINDRLGGLW